MKICLVTGTRAEYGILYPLIKKIQQDTFFDLSIIVTGMHLSTEFGLTIKEIENDNILIDKKIEILLASDTSIGISKSMGLAQISFSEAFEDITPDLLLVLGDRYEIFSVVSTAMIHNIPIAHIAGGESTEGLIDEAIRHAITKMSHIHFASTKLYKKRIIQMGENPKNVHNVGALAIDNIMSLNPMTLKELKKDLNIKWSKRNYLVTFHPITLNVEESLNQLKALLLALSELKDSTIIFTKANSDMSGRKINEEINHFVKEHANSYLFSSLGHLRYHSLLKMVDAMIGNSSSGIVESPSWKIPTINIGDRQEGRIQAKSIINALPEYNSIKKALKKLHSPKFQQNLEMVKNPYGNGNTSEKIIEILKQTDLSTIIKKKFYDLK